MVTLKTDSQVRWFRANKTLIDNIAMQSGKLVPIAYESGQSFSFDLGGTPKFQRLNVLAEYKPGINEEYQDQVKAEKNKKQMEMDSKNITETK
jgi:hypothetical protein